MSVCGAFISSIISDENVLVDGVLLVVAAAAAAAAVVVMPTVVVVGMAVILSVVVLVVVIGVNVVSRVDSVVAVLAVRFGSTETVVGTLVVVVADGVVVQMLVDVVLGVVIASAIDLAVVLITRPSAATVVLVTLGSAVVDLEAAAVRGASRNCAMSRGSVPSIAPALRIECCLMLSASDGYRQGNQTCVRTSFVSRLDRAVHVRHNRAECE